MTTSGSTPWFSTSQSPLGEKKATLGDVTWPPSMRTGISPMPTRPPQVRLPTSVPNFAFFEEPWQRVTAGTGILIGDHDFRAVDCGVGGVLDFAVARRPIGFEMAAKHFNEIVRDLASGVESLVNDGTLFLGLRKIVAIEVGEAAFSGIGKINVGKLSAGELIDLALIGFDPIDVAQTGFARNGRHGDVARVFAAGFRDAQADDMARGAFEELLNVDGWIEVHSIDVEDAVAGLEVEARVEPMEPWLQG